MIFNALKRSGVVWACLLIGCSVAFGIYSVDGAELGRFSIVGDLTETQLNDAQAVLEDSGIRGRDIDAIKKKLEELDWVNDVNVRKSWPSGMTILVRPEQVIAYWNDDAFVNKEGEVFSSGLLNAGDVPHLYGGIGSEKEVMRRYQELNQMLLISGLDILVLKLNERGSWSVETRDRVQILLGKEDLKARLRRFLAVSEYLQKEKQVDGKVILKMDARYLNGVAVHFQGELMDEEIEVAELNNSAEERSL